MFRSPERNPPATMSENPPAPPVAPRIPHSFTHHGVTVDDPYAWLRDAAYPEVGDPAVLSYLAAENAYFNAMMEPHKALVATPTSCCFRIPAALPS